MCPAVGSSVLAPVFPYQWRQLLRPGGLGQELARSQSLVVFLWTVALALCTPVSLGPSGRNLEAATYGAHSSSAPARGLGLLRAPAYLPSAPAVAPMVATFALPSFFVLLPGTWRQPHTGHTPLSSQSSVSDFFGHRPSVIGPGRRFDGGNLCTSIILCLDSWDLEAATYGHTPLSSQSSVLVTSSCRRHRLGSSMTLLSSSVFSLWWWWLLLSALPPVLAPSDRNLEAVIERDTSSSAPAYGPARAGVT